MFSFNNWIKFLIEPLFSLNGCGGSDTTEEEVIGPTEEVEEPEIGEEEEMGLTGEILIDGSSTVFPITQAVAEEFTAVHPNVNISVDVSGTGGGFEKFCIGEITINNASRPINDNEKILCKKKFISLKSNIL